MKIQADIYQTMSEIRKVLQLSSSTFAVSLPKRDAKYLNVNKGDLLEIILWDNKTIAIRKLDIVKKTP